MLINISFTEGTETNAVAQTAVKTILMAAKGKASFSGIIAATPKPCPAAPIPNPRLTGSSILNESNNPRPTVAPKMPVRTTTDAAIAISPPSNWVITIAKAVVTFLLSNESLTIVLDPMFSKRTYHAVPNNPPKAEQSIATTTTAKFSAIIFLRLYIATERQPTAGPSRNSNKSPAPVFVGERDPVRYVLSTSSKDEPVISESNRVRRSVPVVLVTRGWTTLVNEEGRRAPKT
mmetsp:Transcript_16419/g.35545  ORF Transcript_16419/g.35545 Transcript_16419/m.35545 type:complete len:233 (-) Transcript_16419:900-1598(-)